MIGLWDQLLSFYVYALHFLPPALLILPGLYWLFREVKTEKGWQLLLGVFAFAACAVALLYLACELPKSPTHAWSSGRLTQGVAWARGYKMYYALGEGPMIVQMYGPITALIYSVTSIASRPTVAVLIGASINLLFNAVPAIGFLITANRSRPAIFAWVGIALFVVILSRQPILSESATRVTIEGPAIAFAVGAMTLLLRFRTEQNRPFRSGLICGLLVACCLWSKATFFPIAVLSSLYGLMVAPPRAAVRFIGGLLFACAVVSAIILIWLGPPVLIQNVLIPSRHPWQWPELGKTGAVRRTLWRMWMYARPAGTFVLFTLLLCGVIAWLSHRLAPVGGARAWIRRNPWLLPVTASILLIPTTTLAMVKWGGSWNNATTWIYFLLLGACCSLNQACAPRSESVERPLAMIRFARIMAIGMLIAACWVHEETAKYVRSSLAFWTHLSDNESESAYRYAKAHPQEAWFPTHPLAMLMADGQLYHFTSGLNDLEKANIPVSDEYFQAYLPRSLNIVFYKEQTDLGHWRPAGSGEDIDSSIFSGWKEIHVDARPSKTSAPPPKPS